MSYNNFSGQTPTGNQLQTLNDPSIYAGNPYLCGDPLPKKCTGVNDRGKGSGVEVDKDEDKEDKHDKMWFYLLGCQALLLGFGESLGLCC